MGLSSGFKVLKHAKDLEQFPLLNKVSIKVSHHCWLHSHSLLPDFFFLLFSFLMNISNGLEKDQSR